MKRKIALILIIMTAVLTSNTTRAEEGLSLKDCIRKALKHSYSIQAGKFELEGAQYTKKSAFGAYLPSITVEGKYIYMKQWDYEKPSFNLKDMGMPMDKKIEMDFMPIPDQIYSFKVSAAQPLSYLYTVYLSNTLQENALEITKLKQSLTKMGVGMQVVMNYYGIKLAESGLKIAETAKEQIETHIKDAENFLRQGLITNGDLLKIKMQGSKVEQMLIEARMNVQLAKNRLAYTIGEKSSNLSISDLPEDELDPIPCNGLNECIDKGIRNRKELKILRKSIGIADTTTKIAWMSLIPNILAFAAYQYQNDGSDLTADQSWSIGVMLSWNIWDWGQNYYKAKAAGTKREKALMDYKKATEDAKLEIEQSYQKVLISKQKIETAKVALEQAKENYRIEKEKFAVQQTTSSNLMDAESALLQAEIGLEMARFEYRMNLAALRVSMGMFPVEGNF